jgi:ABC-2 type transport system ATP-binding protein
MVPIIETRSLRKTFAIPVREPGLGAALRSLVKREYRQVQAVADITFSLEPGEVVGFLGPNGAGKTTTLKMLSGLVHPSGGEARVLGHDPWQREPAFLRNISLVMGQRSQLAWDLPALDSFDINRAVYRIPTAEYKRTLAELTDLLEIGSLLDKPVRNLSLGERMKCELCAALLHRPPVLFLDEPTIGMDVVAQRRLRQFIAEYNRLTGATVLLTSHYMADVEALCKRVIVIHHGRVLFDGALSDLSARFAANKIVVVELAERNGTDLSRYGEVVADTGAQVTFRFPKAEVAASISRMLADLPVTDLTVKDPPIEETIEKIFTGGE